MHNVVRIARNFKYIFINTEINIDDVVIQEVADVVLPNIFMALYQRNKEASKCPEDFKIWNFAASHKGKYCGFVELVARPERCFPFDGYWVHGLFVKHSHRRSGIGQLLIKKLIDTANKEDITCICMLVNKSNTPAISLYQKQLFQFENDKTLEKNIISMQPLFKQHRLMLRKMESSHVMPTEKSS